MKQCLHASNALLSIVVLFQGLPGGPGAKGDEGKIGERVSGTGWNS